MALASRSFYVFCLLLVCTDDLTHGNNISLYTETSRTYDPTKPYCFRFTWLGTEFTKENVVNTTCSELLDAKRDNHIPCRNPLFHSITDDATPPDIDYLWENHRDKVVARQANGQVCVKYSYIYNNIVQNVTYLNTKVSMSGGKIAVTNGCYMQTVDGYDVELCVCESFSGIGKPCNAAPITIVTLGVLMLPFFVIVMHSFI
ncbi:hypothetical protein RI129_007782 [Pyrocoelia pectoralis]|uniref:Uncharacterized protein n=1 Tax=Pyrocoelia pectoralis TaxID=417401 RepID=A0AAN7ZHB3_9COLE